MATVSKVHVARPSWQLARRYVCIQDRNAVCICMQLHVGKMSCLKLSLVWQQVMHVHLTAVDVKQLQQVGHALSLHHVP